MAMFPLRCSQITMPILSAPMVLIESVTVCWPTLWGAYSTMRLATVAVSTCSLVQSEKCDSHLNAFLISTPSCSCHDRNTCMKSSFSTRRNSHGPDGHTAHCSSHDRQTAHYSNPGGHTAHYSSPGGHTAHYSSPGGHTPHCSSPGGHTAHYSNPGGHTAALVDSRHTTTPLVDTRHTTTLVDTRHITALPWWTL